ncbi:PKD domain-containing protein, partial [Coraliomargarita sp. SDUM461004]
MKRRDSTANYTVFGLLLFLLIQLVWYSNPPSELQNETSANDYKQEQVVSTPSLLSPKKLVHNKTEDFQQWLEAWRQLGHQSSDPQFLIHGIALAEQHRLEMEQLILSDPDTALERALSYYDYVQLPEAIQARVEEPFSEVSDISVVIDCGASDHPLHYHMKSSTGDAFRLYMPTAHRVALSKRKLPVQGIRLNGKAVARANVFQIVTGSEADWLTKNWPSGQQDKTRCYLTGEAITGRPTITVAGGRVFHFQDTDSVHILEQVLSEADAKAGINNGSAWIMRTVSSEGFPIEAFQRQVSSAALQATTGAKTVLVILTDFPDYPNQSFNAVDIESMLDEEVDHALRAYSYNKMSLDGSVTNNVIRAQYNSSYYENNYNTLHDEIVAQYMALGHANPFSEYDSVCIAIAGTQLDLVGLADVGGQAVWIELSGYDDDHVFTHELGHNYGLHHANYWDHSSANPNSLDPVDPTGSSEEYGDIYDTMGSPNRSYLLDNHFHMAAKEQLGWITESQWSAIETAANNGTYRIYQFDHEDAAGLQALRIRKSASNDYYWLGYRHEQKETTVLQNSAYLLWEKADGLPELNQCWLIDTTPGSEQGKIDAGIAIGRTYSDTVSNVHITPISKGGSSPQQYLDIVVNLGTFSTNVAPSGTLIVPSTAIARENVQLSAQVIDANNDALAYHWNLGDGSMHASSASITHSWGIGGSYPITLTVSDMKGGTTTIIQTITVSDPLNTWLDRSSGTALNLLGIAANETHVVAVGANGTILRSVDGATWTKQPLSGVAA